MRTQKSYRKLRPAAALALLAVLLGICFRLSPGPSEPPGVVAAGQGTDQAAFRHAEAGPIPVVARRTTSDLERALRQDDVCAVYQFLLANDLSSAPVEAAARLLLDQKNPISTGSAEAESARAAFARGLLIPDQRETLSFLSYARSETAELYKALILSELLTGYDFARPDAREAVAILEGLKAHNPRNGAYPYFLAELKHRLGYAKAEVRAEILDAVTGPEFDTFLLDHTRALMERGFTSVSYLLLARYLVRMTPMPNYIDTMLLARQVLSEESDPAINQAALAFGKHLMSRAAKQSYRQEGIFWLALEYGAGQIIGAQAWAGLHPGEEPPTELMRSYQELLAEHDPGWNEAFDDLEGRAPERAPARAGDPASVGCRRERIDRIFRGEREFYLNRAR